jgi:hypothetical protein
MPDAQEHPKSFRFGLKSLVVLLLFGLNAGFLGYLWVTRADRGALGSSGGTPVEQVLARPLENSLPDVSQLGADFRTKISLKPLCEGHIKRIEYHCETEASFRVVQDGKVKRFASPSRSPRRRGHRHPE